MGKTVFPLLLFPTGRLPGRRFYRQKYDARKPLEEFSAQIRNETDLDALRDDLVGAIRKTMRPERASLWLRPGTASGNRRALR